MEFLMNYSGYVIVFSFALISLIASFFFVIIKHNRHKKELQTLIDNYGGENKKFLEFLRDRTTHYITNYHIFLVSEKIPGVLSMWLSVSALFLSNIYKDCLVLNNIVSIFAILCVFIVLYFSPRRRIVEYKKAWKESRSLIIKVGMGEITADEANNGLEKIEDNLKSDDE